jgi:multicomponent Na+:H+ antiporter subunit D
MTSSFIHPGLIMIIGSVLVPVLPRGAVRKGYLLLLPAAAFISVLCMQEGTYGAFSFLSQDIVLGRVDKLSLIFGYIFTLAAFASILYGLHVEESGHHVASLVYPGSAIGAVFAGDYLTLLFFWEFMAFASVFLILYGNTKKSYDAAYRYVLVHVFSGICLMGGIILHYHANGSFAFNHVEGGLNLANSLILVGFIINAAVPPLSAWLPDAYPEASVTGAVFLSAFTTKTAVYVLARGFAGTEILMYLGAVMSVYGVVFAVLENNMRRLLAYHIVSQVGFMVCGVGIGSELAINGASAHAFAHILYKGLLFMGAGAVLYMTGKRKLTEMGGLYKTMPWTFLLFMIGAFAIAAVPLTSGFVSKSMTLSAAGEGHYKFAWLMMTLASTGTFLSIALKIGYYAFFGKDAGLEAKDPPLNMLLGMAIPAFFCIFMGFYPQYLYNMLPFEVDYHPYTADHVVWSGQLLLCTALGFFGFLKVAAPKEKIALDTDWFYRKGGKVFLCFAYNVALAIDEVVSNAYRTVLLTYSKLVAAESFTFDKRIVDGAVNGVAAIVLRLGLVFRRMQTGQLQHYAIIVLIGVVILLNVIFIFR